MRDTIRRIQRHRLSRYAPGDEPVVRRLRWIWPLAMVWLVYVVALSDHGFYRIWRLHDALAGRAPLPHVLETGSEMLVARK